MAAAQLSLTRRALLAGACAAPVAGVDVVRHPGLDPGSPPPLFAHAQSSEGNEIPDQVRDDGKWAKALERYRRAEAGLAAVAHSEDDGLYDRALGRFNAALKRLLRVPAPDLAALAMKLDLILDQALWELTGADRFLAALRADAHRFAGRG